MTIYEYLEKGPESDKGLESKFQSKVTQCESASLGDEPKYCEKSMVEDLGNIPGNNHIWRHFDTAATPYLCLPSLA